MKKFAFLSDLLFTFFVSGVFTLVWFRYLQVNLPSALFLSGVCGGLTTLAVGAFLARRRKNLYLNKSDERLKQKLLLHLALLSDEEKTDYLVSALSTGENPLHRFGKLRLFTPTEFYFLRFTLNPLTLDEIPNLARLKTSKKKILLCGQIEDAALALCRRLNIEVKTGEWIFKQLKNRNALPDEYLGDEPQKKPKHPFKLWFARANAKRFLLSGTLVLLLSRLTPFSIYYLLCGCALLLTAVFVRIFGQA